MSERDKYRDDDDVRDILQEREGTTPDTKSEARGDARENVGNTARGTASNPTDPEGNDGTRQRPRADAFDADFERDDRDQN